MSTLFPLPKPLALQIAVAAVTQSGAPLGAGGHFSCPLTVRAFGMRATASAASLAPSTVVLAASLAALLKPSSFFCASLNVEFTLVVCSSNHRLTAAIKPSFWGVFCVGAA